MQRLIVAGARAQEPVASSEGLGGTYFFSSEAAGRVGIMKPVDEEPLAPNNPKVRARRHGAAAVPGVPGAPTCWHAAVVGCGSCWCCLFLHGLKHWYTCSCRCLLLCVSLTSCAHGASFSSDMGSTYWLGAGCAGFCGARARGPGLEADGARWGGRAARGGRVPARPRALCARAHHRAGQGALRGRAGCWAAAGRSACWRMARSACLCTMTTL